MKKTIYKKGFLFIAGLALTVGIAFCSSESVRAELTEQDILLAKAIAASYRRNPDVGQQMLEARLGAATTIHSFELIERIISEIYTEEAKGFVGVETAKYYPNRKKLYPIFHQVRTKLAQLRGEVVGDRRVVSLVRRAQENGYQDVIERARALPAVPGERFEAFVGRMFQGIDFGLRFQGDEVNPTEVEPAFKWHLRDDVDADQSSGGLKLHAGCDLKHYAQMEAICKKIAKRYNCQYKFYSEDYIDLIMRDAGGFLQSGKFFTLYIPDGSMKLMALAALELEMELRAAGLNLNSMVAEGLDLVESDDDVRRIIANGDGISLPGDEMTGLLSFRHEGLRRGYRRDIADGNVRAQNSCEIESADEYHAQEVRFHQQFSQLLKDIKTIFQVEKVR